MRKTIEEYFYEHEEKWEGIRLDPSMPTYKTPCSACEEHFSVFDEQDCREKECPCMLAWPGENGTCFDQGRGLSDRFEAAGTPEERSLLALCIRSLDLSPRAINLLLQGG